MKNQEAEWKNNEVKLQNLLREIKLERDNLQATVKDLNEKLKSKLICEDKL